MTDLLSYPAYDSFPERETSPEEESDDEVWCEECEEFLGNLEDWEHEHLVPKECVYCENQREEKEFEERYERVKKEFGEEEAERLEIP